MCIVPAEVIAFLNEQSIAAYVPQTKSGLAPIGNVVKDLLNLPAETAAEPITDDTRFSLTPKGEAALAACKSTPTPRVRPACPLCGSDVWEAYERFGKFLSCENANCYYCESSGPYDEDADADCDYERNFERRVA